MTKNKERPNLVIILTDQHSPHVLGCAGDGVVRTPRLDQLAATGVTFRNAYCASPVCGPSRMSFMTGRTPSHNQSWTNDCVLRSDIPTFAHSLGAAGYRVTLAGRMHFRGPDQFHGFEERIVGERGASWIGARVPTLGSLAGTAGQSRISVENSGPGLTPYQRYDTDVTAGAVEYLQNYDDERPFCLVVGFVLPHCPYVCPRDLFDYYYERVDVPVIEREAQHPVIQRWMAHRGIYEPPLDAETIRRARAAYYGMVEMVDRNVGSILDALSATPFANSTPVFYTSDHGEMAGEHGLWWKSNMYEASVNVPLIASWPGEFPAGTTVEHNVSLMDVGPTCIDLAGAPALPDADGQSLVEALRTGRFADRKNQVVSELFATRNKDVPVEWGNPAMRMVRQGPWKLVYYHNAGCQLFNLDEDPHEEHDRANDIDARPVLLTLLRRATEEWDPDAVESELYRRLAYNELQQRWTQTVDPPDPHRWQQPDDALQLDYQWPSPQS